MIQRYGKSIYDFSSIKEKFFATNDSLLAEDEKLTAIYKSQNIRKKCKICESPISGEPYFINRGTKYFQCLVCGHINGEFNDGIDYATALYVNKKNDLYGSQFREATKEEYIRRLDAIYLPKARFLIDSLSKIEPEYKTFNYLDIGAGAGYMVGALDRFFVKVSGIDVDKNQAAYANKIMGEGGNRIDLIEIDTIAKYVEETNKQVLLFIGVLEHITNLSEILNKIKNNKNVKYILLVFLKWV